ncbi:MAG: class I SAM-dependent methyltransferase [Chitinophagaceae bacterium]|nr:class I SAM-dependent methyltransferase [Chitinophagaceae bacterium]
MFDWLRYGFVKAKNAIPNRRFGKKHPELKIPPDYYLYETYSLNYEQYISDGLATAKEFVDLLKPYANVSEEKKVLDWGCGPGRITRHLKSVMPNAEITGIDYNYRYIDWCRQNLPGVAFRLNSIEPPTDLENDEFDIVIGLSVFTHFSRASHYRWVSELYRILKPGGVTLITTQGGSYSAKLTLKERKVFNTGQLVVRDNVLEGNRLFSAFQPGKFMRELIDGKLELLEFIPGSVENNAYIQDIWILRKN